MSMPLTPPPPTVTYRVQINSEDWQEYGTPVNSSKYVADNIAYGHQAVVEFRNAKSVQLVRRNFNKRIDGWLRQVGHTSGFVVEPNEIGACYRLAN